MTAYYNEHDPFAAEWLIALIDGGHIAPGYVDTRDIQEVQPSDLEGFTQCHFFAGIGGWSLALRLAGWPDNRPVWTGSCPCQPFSAAGKGGGESDPRHLWPEWFRLIRESRPGVVFGEQVEAAIRHGWLDTVSTGMETEGYAFGACVLGAHSVGAPHIRQRVWFVADAEHAERRSVYVNRGHGRDGQDEGRSEAHGESGACREVRGTVADPDGGRSSDGDVQRGGEHGQQPQDGGAGRIVGDAMRGGQQEPPQRDGDPEPHPAHGHPSGSDVDRSNPWASAVWLPCRDGKARPTQSTIQRLVDGLPGGLGLVRVERRAEGEVEGEEAVLLAPLVAGGKARVGRLRGYGNAINPYTAAAFIESWLEVKAGME